MPNYVDQSTLLIQKRDQSDLWVASMSVFLTSRCACESRLFSVSVGSEMFSKTESLPTVDKLGTPEEGLVSDYLEQPGRV